MGRRGTYIYGIVNGGAKAADGDASYPDGVHAVPFKDVAAVVADGEMIDLEGLSREDLAHLLLKHQRVIETLMAKNMTVIPMKLGTFALNEEEALSILDMGYTTIMKAFENVGGKVEDDVVALWTDLDVVLKQIAGEPDIAALKGEMLAKKEGVTIDDQMKVGFLVKKRLDEKKKRYASEIFDVLKDVSIRRREHDCPDDAMIMNGAFLVSRTGLKAFMEKLEQLGRRFDTLIRFRCVGPLPAYSFATLEVSRVDRSEIDWARKRLGIGDAANREEIKKAYRSCSFVCHPDSNADGGHGDADFHEVNRAYKILDQCCHDDLFSFKGEGDRSEEIVVQIRE